MRPKNPCAPHRYKLALWSAAGLLVVIGGRTSFGLVMTHAASGNRSVLMDSIVFSHCTVFNTSRDQHVAGMESDTLFMLHTVFFAGMTAVKVPASVLALRFSPRRVVGLTILMTSILSLSLPTAVTALSKPLLFTFRAAAGLLEGIHQPIVYAILSAWTARADNTRLTTIFLTGCYLAPGVAFFITGFTLCYVSWNSVLILYGGLGVLWTVVWFRTFYDTPDLHPSLSVAERQYLKDQGTGIKQSSKQMFQTIPWRRILCSLPVWAVFLGYFSHAAVFSVVVYGQPQYYLDAFGMRTSDIGLLSTLPSIGLSIVCPLGGVICDKLLDLGWKQTLIRKLAYTLGSGTEALCLMSLYFTSDWKTAMILISTGISVGGFSLLMAEMAPQYAGVIASLAMLGTSGAVVINIMSFSFLGPTGTLEDWQRLFLVTGLILLAIVIVFDVIASAERQPWSSAAHREFDVTDDDARATVTSTSGETTTCHSEYKSDETPLLSEDVSDVKFGGDCKTKYGVASYRPATQCKEHT